MKAALLILLAVLVGLAGAGCVKDDYRRWERHCMAHKL